MGKAEVSRIESKSVYPRLVRRQLNRRVAELAREEGLTSIVRRVVASRINSLDSDLRTFLNGSLRELDHPEYLVDMEDAAKRIANAIERREIIGLETDYDQDGLGGMAVMWRSFTEEFNHPASHLQRYIGHRLLDGYGLSDNLANRMLDSEVRPNIVITADNGSSDQKRIHRLKEQGIDVIVTDHHEIPAEGPPKSAFACINPQRQDCEFPDKNVAGGMVAWLLMCSVRRVLVERGKLTREGSRLAGLLDYVACSTVADCVSMASKNNRAVVKHGLRLMNRRERACWSGIDRFLRGKEITAETIAFGIAPRVNAQTRISSAEDAICFLVSDSHEEAEKLADALDRHNQERKEIEAVMVSNAIESVEKEMKDDQLSIAILLEEGHPGVQGICSSRLVERFGVPAFTFCRNVDDEGLITGSGRSDKFVPLKKCLEVIETEKPDLMLKFGGHAAAAGVTIKEKDFERFRKMFENAVSGFTVRSELGPYVQSDGELKGAEITLDTLDALSVLEPTGRGFESAQFDGEFLVNAVKPVGDGTHLQLSLSKEFKHFKGIWFRARRSKDDDLPVNPGDMAEFVYRLSDGGGYGPRRLQLQISARVG